MNQDKEINWTFWISLLALVISIIALCVFIVKVEPSSVVTTETYIGVMATFIGAAVTILVGYQIYNSLDLRQRINEVEKLKDSLERQKEQMEIISLEQNEGFEILQARLYSKQSGMDYSAFLKIHSAIQYSLSIDHKKEGYKWLLDEMKEYMLNITLSSVLYGGTKNDYTLKVNEIRDLYKDDEQKIKEHPNYLYIKDRYEDLMAQFEKRLDNISNQINVSLNYIDKTAEEENQK